MANAILNKAFILAKISLEAYLFLKSKGHYKLADQIVSSGTSVGANVEEAQAAHSKLDFISKLTIANKEARETKYWISFLNEPEFLSDFRRLEEMEKVTEEVILLLNAIIKKTRDNLD